MGIVNLRHHVFGFIIGLIALSSYADKPLSTVADLRYGVALYEYYQGNHADALTELLVAKKRGGIKGHGDNPEIMEGGFSMAYGMERHASQIFERLLEENRPVSVRDSAWFYLSKLRYLREDWEGTKDALDRISKKPALGIRHDILAQKVNLAIKQDRLEDAAALLRKHKNKKGWLPYLSFNLGSAYARKGDFETAISFYSELKLKHKLFGEHKALYDKAMTAAGYSSVFTKNYPQAIDYFSRVRLTSALSNKALLGYGWAAAEMNNFEEALKPWTYLSEQTLIDENSLEALVAVPHAYEELELYGKALEKYKTGEARYVAEIQRLDEVVELMHGDTLMQALRIRGSSGLDWLKYAKEKQLEPKLSYLADLFAKEEFQVYVHEMRDLIAIKDNLLSWQDRLTFIAETLETRQAFRSGKQEALAAGSMTEAINDMQRHRNYLAKKIKDIKENEDYLALADEEQGELVERVLRIKKNIELLRKTDPFIDESEEMSRWYYGIMMWETSETYPDRLWKIEKSLTQLDRSIRKAKNKHKAVRDILRDADDIEEKKRQIVEYQARIAQQLALVEQAIEQAKFNLSTDIVSILQEQRRRVTVYLGQSRLAIARLYDRSNPEVWGNSKDDNKDNDQEGDQQEGTKEADVEQTGELESESSEAELPESATQQETNTEQENNEPQATPDAPAQEETL